MYLRDTKNINLVTALPPTEDYTPLTNLIWQ